MSREAIVDFEAAARAVVYRGTLADGAEGEIRLRMRPERATLRDAWARLVARYGDVDPLTVEIEIRDGDQRKSASAACW
jgi:hypothetical protein